MKRVFRDIRKKKFAVGQEIVIAKNTYVHAKGAHCELRTVSKIADGKVYVHGANGKGNYWLRKPENAAILGV